MFEDVETIIMAGGEGRRLMPLTKYRPKPAVPFGGKYRIIDFVLSNCLNSGLRRIYVLTQYRSGSLLKHIQEGWHISSSGLGNEYIYCVPAQQKISTEWYKGTADAIRQNLDLISDKKVKTVIILSGDHIYKMNYKTMLDYHLQHGADLTIAAIKVDRELAKTLGVIEVDEKFKLISFVEKPLVPKTIPNEPQYSYVSMGIYIFKSEVLMKVLEGSGNDFGKEIIPKMIGENYKIWIYDYIKYNKIADYIISVNNGVRQKVLVDRTSDSAYWRDVGTIESYFEASMDLIGVNPVFNLYGERWPFRTLQRPLPPTKFVLGGLAHESILSDGCIISGGKVWRAILSPSVIIEKDALVEESIIFDNVTIEPGAKIRRSIIDKDVTVCAGVKLGYNSKTDLERGCTISASGIVIVPRNSVIGSC